MLQHGFNHIINLLPVLFPQPAELFRQQGFFDLVSGFQYAAKQKLRRYVERVGDGDVTGIITDCGKIREYETLCFMRNDTFLCSD